MTCPGPRWERSAPASKAAATPLSRMSLVLQDNEPEATCFGSRAPCLLWVIIASTYRLQSPYPTHICLVRQPLCLLLDFGIELLFHRSFVCTPCLSLCLYSLFSCPLVLFRLISGATDGPFDVFEAAGMSIALARFIDLHTSFHLFVF